MSLWTNSNGKPFFKGLLRLSYRDRWLLHLRTLIADDGIWGHLIPEGASDAITSPLARFVGSHSPWRCPARAQHRGRGAADDHTSRAPVRRRQQAHLGPCRHALRLL